MIHCDSHGFIYLLQKIISRHKIILSLYQMIRSFGFLVPISLFFFSFLILFIRQINAKFHITFRKIFIFSRLPAAAQQTMEHIIYFYILCVQCVVCLCVSRSFTRIHIKIKLPPPAHIFTHFNRVIIICKSLKNDQFL